MISSRKQKPPATVPADLPTPHGLRNCTECAASIPPEGCWCPQCGRQVHPPCWSCARPLEPGAAFCAYCGTRATEPAVVQCSECRAAVPPGAGYCTACGAQARIVCGECDRPLLRDWSFCPACGGQPSSETDGEEDGDEEPGDFTTSAPVSVTPDSLNDAGTRAYEAENFHEAARLFREAIAADGENSRYWTNLGVACGEMGDEIQALRAYRRAVELNPGELSAYLHMGSLFMSGERTAEAREMWESVIRQAPDSEEAAEARDCLKHAEEL